MKKAIGFATLVLILLAMVTGAIIAQENSRPWVDENGVWDMSKVPTTQGVVDSSGTQVGVVMTEDLLGDVHPLPVYSVDDHTLRVGSVGSKGYWALGESEPECDGCYTVIETVDDDGNTSTETIYD